MTSELEQAIVADNDTYRVVDTFLPFLGGMTVSRTDLRGEKSTRGHSHEKQEELYIFLSAYDVSMLVGTQMRKVASGSVVYVPAGYFHRVTNHGATDCVFLALFLGKPERPTLK